MHEARAYRMLITTVVGFTALPMRSSSSGTYPPGFGNPTCKYRVAAMAGWRRIGVETETQLMVIRKGLFR